MSNRMHRLLAALVVSPFFVAFTVAEAQVHCASQSSDADGDGWGWENHHSCKITNTSKVAVCTFDSDPDGDGWGWENGQSCLMGSGQENTNATP
jgi:mannan endo-1,4-beta-mannosidase